MFYLTDFFPLCVWVTVLPTMCHKVTFLKLLIVCWYPQASCHAVGPPMELKQQTENRKHILWTNRLPVQTTHANRPSAVGGAEMMNLFPASPGQTSSFCFHGELSLFPPFSFSSFLPRSTWWVKPLRKWMKLGGGGGGPFIQISGLLWGRYEDQMGSLVRLSGFATAPGQPNCHFAVIMIKDRNLDVPFSQILSSLLPAFLTPVLA